jgi:hypothetical protein
MDKPQANTDSQDSPRPRLGGSDHLRPYIILYAWPWGQHPNVIFSQDSQLGNLEIPEIGTFVILEAHNVLYKPLIEVKFEEICGPCQDFPNDMWHATFIQVNQGGY